MAPEVLLKQPTTVASDVYAWAVTVNEIATGIFPFADCTKDNPQCQTVLNFGYGRSGLSQTSAPQRQLAHRAWVMQCLLILSCCLPHRIYQTMWPTAVWSQRGGPEMACSLIGRTN